jgi:hypothetical protein
VLLTLASALWFMVFLLFLIWYSFSCHPVRQYHVAYVGLVVGGMAALGLEDKLMSLEEMMLVIQTLPKLMADSRDCNVRYLSSDSGRLQPHWSAGM